MAGERRASPQDGDTKFIEGSLLTYIIPFTTEFKLEEALQQADESHKSLFESIERRQWLFFGEPLEPAPGILSPHAHAARLQMKPSTCTWCCARPTPTAIR